MNDKSLTHKSILMVALIVLSLHGFLLSGNNLEYSKKDHEPGIWHEYPDDYSKKLLSGDSIVYVVSRNNTTDYYWFAFHKNGVINNNNWTFGLYKIKGDTIVANLYSSYDTARDIKLLIVSQDELLLLSVGNRKFDDIKLIAMKFPLPIKFETNDIVYSRSWLPKKYGKWSDSLFLYESPN